MASSRTEGSRKAKAGDAVTNRQKQLEAFTQGPENLLTTNPVSYTHLTLPTIYSV